MSSIDPFTGQNTALQGASLPNEAAQDHIFDDHGRRLEAFDCLRAAATKCGIATDPDRDLAIIPEDAVSLLESTGSDWGDLGKAIRGLRKLLPLCPLQQFGFPADSEDALAEGSPLLRHIGGGVEAWAFQSGDGSIYKFFRPIDGQWIGATFDLQPDEEYAFRAIACSGSYCDLLEKIDVINSIGMPTEVLAITPEGILVTKQCLGERLAEGTDTSPLLPPGLVSWPSRFLRCDRDHPRLAFARDRPWLVADPHDRNIVRAADGSARIIDIVAVTLPPELIAKFPLVMRWIERVRINPKADVLPPVNDDEL